MASAAHDSLVLAVRNINRFFGGLHAVNDVSFDVAEGIIKAIIGPNGAGKTTLFNLIGGGLKPSSGTVAYQGQIITGLKTHVIAAQGVSRTFQKVRLCPKMSVLENVMLGRHTRSKAGFGAAMLNLPWTWREEHNTREKSRAILSYLSIDDVAGSDVSSLPFGKQRLVELARALAAEPRLLLLDEPASGLNLHETVELAGLITRIRDQGMTIVIIEHDMSLVMDISDDILVLNYGQKIAEGTPREIQANREVINIYLGEEDA